MYSNDQYLTWVHSKLREPSYTVARVWNNQFTKKIKKVNKKCYGRVWKFTQKVRLRKEGRDCLKLGCSLNPPQGASCAAETKTKMQRFNIYCKLKYACLGSTKASHIETISTFFESTDPQNQKSNIKSCYSKMTHRLESDLFNNPVAFLGFFSLSFWRKS